MSPKPRPHGPPFRPRCMRVLAKRLTLGTLRDCSRKGGSWVYRIGYSDLSMRFLPYLQRLLAAKPDKETRWLLSDSYYYLGHCWDFVDAFEASAAAYCTSVELDPLNAAGFREWAGMLAYMNRFAEAEPLFLKALELDPNDEMAKQDYEFAQDSQSVDSFFNPSDPFWKVSALLAEGKAQEALEVLRPLDGVRALLYRARCYGALGAVDAYVETWEAVARQHELVEPERADWFYLPHIVSEQSLRYHEARLAMPWVYDKGVHSYASWLSDNVADRRERMWADCSFDIADIKGDLALAEDLAAKYPKWWDAEDLVREIRWRQKSGR